MVSIEGENMRPVTWVVVEEVTSGDWGIGGKVSKDRRPLGRWRLERLRSRGRGVRRSCPGEGSP